MRGTAGIATVDAMTSLTAAPAGSEYLLALSRAHWRIESVLQTHTERKFAMNG